MKGTQKLAVHDTVCSSTHVMLEMEQNRLVDLCTERLLYNVLQCNCASHIRLVANPVESAVKSNS